MINKKYILILSLFLPLLTYSQYGDSISKLELFDKAVDLSVYAQTIAKDKLYLVNNLKKEQAAKEMDYVLAKFDEDFGDIDLNEENTNIRTRIEALKTFWQKFGLTATERQDFKDFTAFYYQVNTLDRLVSDLVESMKAAYDLPIDKLQGYLEVQKFRKLIQKITMSYYANFLGLSKSYMHAYNKNIEEINKFVKDNSNEFLNDSIAGKYFADIILDWNFFKTNLLNKKLKMPKTVFSLSQSMDYKLKLIKENYINQYNAGF